MPNPLRTIGLARCLAGGWFITTGVARLRPYQDLVPQAGRLLGGDIGVTDAPIRSLLVLITAPVLCLVGLVLVVKGMGWMRRLALPSGGPAAIERGEVIEALSRGQLLAYADGPTEAYWPLRRWLADVLAEMTWWRRDVMSRSVRAFVRSCGLALAVAVCCFALPFLTTDHLLGPFPTAFVIVLPVAMATWAAFGLMLIPSDGPRIESVELPLSAQSALDRDARPEQIIESRPGMLNQESPGLGLTIGMIGVAVQCLILPWWDLSLLSYPLVATSVIRHTGAIAGGVLFFLLGHRMVVAAKELLLVFRYESVLVLIEDAGGRMVGRAAGVRTASLGISGPRHVVAAVGGTFVLDAAQGLLPQ